MAFDTRPEIRDRIAKITLSGALDANATPAFRAEIEKAALQQPKCLVLIMQDLEYIASAGLRALIFAKQKMGAGIEMYAVAPQEQVMETFKMTGFHYSIQILDTYDHDKIANV